MTRPELVSASEAAGLLGVSPRTIARWATTKRLTVAHKLPGETGALLFHHDDVMALRKELLSRFSPTREAV